MIQIEKDKIYRQTLREIILNQKRAIAALQIELSYYKKHGSLSENFNKQEMLKKIENAQHKINWTSMQSLEDKVYGNGE